MKSAMCLLLAMILLSLDVFSLGVASDYLVNGTMIIEQGTSKIYGIRLQNPTDEDVGIKLDYDQALMKVIDYKEVYTLGPRETGYSIKFNITAPMKTGEYMVGYTVGEVEPAGGGGLPLRLKINKNFKLKVVENPGKFHINFAFVYAAVLLIFAIVLARKLIAKKPKRKSNRKVNKR